MMLPNNWGIAAAALAACLLCSSMVWIVSAFRSNVGLADRAWPLLIMLSAGIFVFTMPLLSSQALAMTLVGSLWAARLCIFITWRGWGKPEDRRYADMRQRNQPYFVWKSLYLVFNLQAVLAWLVSAPFLAIALLPSAATDWSWLDYLGIALALFGLIFEAVADAQMAAFKARPQNHGGVMQDGLWRYSRHPNYFGESCVWWGLGFVAMSSGAWWAMLSPLLITFLLLRVSGINLQENHISSQSAAHLSYRKTTSAFVPLPRNLSKSLPL